MNKLTSSLDFILAKAIRQINKKRNGPIWKCEIFCVLFSYFTGCPSSFFLLQ